MISRRAQENIVVLLLLAFFVAVFVTSLGFSPRARLVPVPISVLAILLLLVQLFWQNFRPADELNVDLLDVLTARSSTAGVTTDRTESKEKKTAAEEQEEEAASWKRVAIAIGFVALLVALTLALGPIPAIFVFTFGYFMLSGHYPLFKAAIYTIVFTLAVYLLFMVALNIQPYHGYLKPLVDYLRQL
jgi:hypothetical protein